MKDSFMEKLAILEMMDKKNKDKYSEMRRLMVLQAIVSKKDFSKSVLLYHFILKNAPKEKTDRTLMRSFSPNERNAIEYLFRKNNRSI